MRLLERFRLLRGGRLESAKRFMKMADNKRTTPDYYSRGEWERQSRQLLDEAVGPKKYLFWESREQRAMRDYLSLLRRERMKTPQARVNEVMNQLANNGLTRTLHPKIMRGIGDIYANGGKFEQVNRHAGGVVFHWRDGDGRSRHFEYNSKSNPAVAREFLKLFAAAGKSVITADDLELHDVTSQLANYVEKKHGVKLFDTLPHAHPIQTAPA